MSSRLWLEQVHARLVRQDLPPRYIRRFMEELSDHLQDLTEETMSTEAHMEQTLARLGEPACVADSAAITYRRRSFVGRHPLAAFLVFGVSPLLLFVTFLVLGLLGFIGFCEAWDFWDLKAAWRPAPETAPAITLLLRVLMIIVPSVLAAVIYCRLARRLGIRRVWPLVSCLVVGIFAILPIWTVQLSEIPGQSCVRFGLRLPGVLGSSWFPSADPMSLIQLFVPLAVGLWFIHHNRRRGQAPLVA